MTSYQQRKKEIRELKERILMLESLLSHHGIYLGQLTINDNKKMSIPKPPSKPLPRQIEGINFEKAFSRFCKRLKYWFSPRDRIFPSESFQKHYAERKAMALENDQIKRAQKLSYVLAKATKEAEQFGKALIRMRRRKKRYSISTPIVRVDEK